MTRSSLAIPALVLVLGVAAVTRSADRAATGAQADQSGAFSPAVLVAPPTLDPDYIVATVGRGRNDMPRFGDTFDASQIRSLAAYITEVLQGGG